MNVGKGYSFRVDGVVLAGGVCSCRVGVCVVGGEVVGDVVDEQAVETINIVISRAARICFTVIISIPFWQDCRPLRVLMSMTCRV